MRSVYCFFTVYRDGEVMSIVKKRFTFDFSLQVLAEFQKNIVPLHPQNEKTDWCVSSVG